MRKYFEWPILFMVTLTFTASMAIGAVSVVIVVIFLPDRLLNRKIEFL